MELHWISLSTRDLGLEQIPVISSVNGGVNGSECQSKGGPNADLHRVITDFSRYIRLILQSGDRDHPKTHPLTDFAPYPIAY